jgi:hypothetical protein
MGQTLQEQWNQLRQDHPSHTRPDLIVAHFQKRLDLLQEFKKIGISRVDGEKMSVDEDIHEVTELLGIMRKPSA